MLRMRATLPFALVFAILSCACSSQSASNIDAGSDVTTGAIAVGTLTLPGTASGKHYEVRIVTAPGAATLTPVATASGTTTGSMSLAYSIANVPAGTYFILGFVDVNGVGGTSSTPGDYAGWYGEDASGNPPAQANATVFVFAGLGLAGSVDRNYGMIRPGQPKMAWTSVVVLALTASQAAPKSSIDVMPAPYSHPLVMLCASRVLVVPA
jgi:hypothetical protein